MDDALLGGPIERADRCGDGLGGLAVGAARVRCRWPAGRASSPRCARPVHGAAAERLARSLQGGGRARALPGSGRSCHVGSSAIDVVRHAQRVTHGSAPAEAGVYQRVAGGATRQGARSGDNPRDRRRRTARSPSERSAAEATRARGDTRNPPTPGAAQDVQRRRALDRLPPRTPMTTATCHAASPAPCSDRPRAARCSSASALRSSSASLLPRRGLGRRRDLRRARRPGGRHGRRRRARRARSRRCPSRASSRAARRSTPGRPWWPPGDEHRGPLRRARPRLRDLEPCSTRPWPSAAAATRSPTASIDCGSWSSATTLARPRPRVRRRGARPRSQPESPPT